jgi:tetratricopeptide (TPR) repeat protein
LYLAQAEYDQAIVHYQAALQVASVGGWYFELGLTYVLAGRLEEALAAYTAGLAEDSADDIQYAKRELDFWTTRQAERVASAEAQQMMAEIRVMLASDEATAT